MRRSVILLSLVAALIVMSGCRYKLARVMPPAFDPDAAAEAAMQQYDANSDGQVDKSELKSAPGLNAVVDRIDENDDGSVTAEELSTMIQEKWIEDGAGVHLVGAKVLLNRRPLEGAVITFEPEEFLGDVVFTATGETDVDGFAAMSVAQENLPHKNIRAGVLPGLYIVRISKEVNGKEIVPKKYNTETTLGVEVASRAAYMPGSAVFELRK